MGPGLQAEDRALGGLHPTWARQPCGRDQRQADARPRSRRNALGVRDVQRGGDHAAVAAGTPRPQGPALRRAFDGDGRSSTASSATSGPWANETMAFAGRTPVAGPFSFHGGTGLGVDGRALAND